ncbi:MAG: hypothetical protein JW797_03440 [Bradymonadales bacterium]|nr:hypothetical protein [Bradymonadales bacterium]
MRILPIPIALAAALLITSLACDGSEEPSPEPDSGRDTSTPDSDAADSNAEEDSSVEDPREVIAVAINRNCWGCQGVSVCGRPPTSDMTVLSFDASLNNQTGLLFASERQEAAGRSLPIDTCRVFEGAERDAVVDPPRNVNCLDGGTLTLDADMSMVREPMVIQYSDLTHNYSSVSVWEEGEYTYSTGVDLALAAEGGADVSAFSLLQPAPEPFELLTPHVDGAGQIDNISAEASLEVTWSGGSDFDEAVIVLFGEYCIYGPETFVACHVDNDGAFTIPQEILEEMAWPNLVQLRISASHKIAFSAAGLSNAPAWSVRSQGDLYVFYDETISPPVQTCDSDSMEEGYVGDPCEDDTVCGGGCCLFGMDGRFFNNYCTLLGCTTDEECPVDGVCVEQTNPFVPIDDYCARICEEDEDCRDWPYYACLDVGDGKKACVPNLL